MLFKTAILVQQKVAAEQRASRSEWLLIPGVPVICSTLASKPYSDRSFTILYAEIGAASVRLAEPEEDEANALMRKLPLFLFQKMSPRSSMPASSRCMAILAPNLPRR